MVMWFVLLTYCWMDYIYRFYFQVNTFCTTLTNVTILLKFVLAYNPLLHRLHCANIPQFIFHCVNSSFFFSFFANVKMLRRIFFCVSSVYQARVALGYGLWCGIAGMWQVCVFSLVDQTMLFSKAVVQSPLPLVAVYVSPVLRSLVTSESLTTSNF